MGNVQKGGRPLCDEHSDCFANNTGKCICLSNNDFRDRDCPFYKPNTETDMERIAAECRLYAETHSGGDK